MHSRLRTHAESIAFFGGGSREKAVSLFIPNECNSKLSCLYHDASEQCVVWCFLSINLEVESKS